MEDTVYVTRQLLAVTGSWHEQLESGALLTSQLVLPELAPLLSAMLAEVVTPTAQLFKPTSLH